MSGAFRPKPVEYLGLQGKTREVVDAIVEELRISYQNKIDELEAKAKFADTVKEDSTFYLDEKLDKLSAIKLYAINTGLDRRELGRLQEAFLKEFYNYSLLIQGYTSNADRNRFDLWAVKNVSCFSGDPYDQRIAREDYNKMRHFVKGFIAARVAWRSKKNHGVY